MDIGRLRLSSPRMNLRAPDGRYVLHEVRTSETPAKHRTSCLASAFVAPLARLRVCPARRRECSVFSSSRDNREEGRGGGWEEHSSEHQTPDHGVGRLVIVDK